MTDPTTPTPSTPKTWYDVSCHCRQTTFKILIPPLGSQQIYSCNCSICAKNGYLNVFPSEIEWPTASGGDDDGGEIKGNLKSYAFGSKKYAHRFCGECGSSVMIEEIGKGQGEGEGFVAVNARMIKGVDLDKLDLVKFDGWNKLQPSYEE